MTNVNTGSNICPVCGEERRAPGNCPECGYDPGKQYEIYPTLGQIRGDLMPVAEWKRKYAASGKTDLDREIARTEAEIRQMKGTREDLEKQIEALRAQIEAIDTGISEKTEVMEELKKVKEASEKIRAGSVLTFGNYAQDREGKKVSPIEWIVLGMDEARGEVLLLSRYGLDTRRYHEKWEDVTWEKGSLRAWLNSEFLSNSFGEEERTGMVCGSVKAEKNSRYPTDPGRDTEDTVFLLSEREAEKYLQTNEERTCKATEHASAAGTRRMAANDTCRWWLRTPGVEESFAVYVEYDGRIRNVGGDACESEGICVRPAIRVKASALLEALERAENAAQVQIGDTLTLGTYAQDEKGTTPTPIEWIVLDKDEEKGRALILSRYGLDVKPYNREYTSVTWETCDLRKWLNGDFLANSFDEKEKGRILESVVKADKNPKYDTDPGRDTKDKVFLLSVPEAERYLETEEKRKCQPTDRAVADGAYSDGGNCLWWLRSPGDYGSNAAYVDCGGAVDNYFVDYDSRCARPALWIDLKS